MFDPHRQPAPLNIPAEPPSSSEFTVRFSATETKAIYLLADRAKVTPQQVVDRLTTASPFRELSFLMGDGWTIVYPERGPEGGADMTDSQEDLAGHILYSLGLLHGEALQRYCREHMVFDPPLDAQ